MDNNKLAWLVEPQYRHLLLDRRILSSFDYPKFMGLSRYCRIKPLAFEYDRIKCFGTTVVELIYFLNTPIIFLLISAGRKYSGIHGPWIGTTLLVPCCVEAISIHVISVK
jgi:hypothetical protein